MKSIGKFHGTEKTQTGLKTPQSQKSQKAKDSMTKCSWGFEHIPSFEYNFICLLKTIVSRDRAGAMLCTFLMPPHNGR